MQNKEIAPGISPLDLISKIKEKISPGIYISTAESCTGGMVASFLTRLPGSSKYFTSGIVSYSNSSKIKLLSVNRETLERFGAVSKEVVREMAQGSKKIADSDIAVSITGVAGPDSDVKPVGSVYFGLASNDNIQDYYAMLYGSRDEIRMQSCSIALQLILSVI